MQKLEEPTQDLELIRRDPKNRRAFLARMGAAGLGVAAASLMSGTLLAGCGGGNNGPLNTGGSGGGGGGNNAFPGIPGSNINIQALNFALTLEFLEADLYRQALNIAAGRPIGQALDANAPGANSVGGYNRTVAPGGIPASLVDAAFLYLVQFAYVEKAHAQFLTMAIPTLGGQPVTPKTYAFPGGPGATLEAILNNVLVLEETGVRAYLGAVPFITDLGLIQTAGTIFSTEARHSAAVSYIVNGGDPGPRRNPPGVPGSDKEVTANPPSEKAFEKFLEPSTVIQGLQPFIVG